MAMKESLIKAIFSFIFSVFTIARSSFNLEKEDTIEPNAKNKARIPNSALLYILDKIGSPPIFINWDIIVPNDNIETFLINTFLLSKIFYINKTFLQVLIICSNIIALIS